EARLAPEQPGRLGPPAVLLGPVAVAPGRLLRLEPGQADEPPVLGHPGGRPQPAVGPGRQLRRPPVHRRPDLPRGVNLSLNHLDEHRDPLCWTPPDTGQRIPLSRHSGPWVMWWTAWSMVWP